MRVPVLRYPYVRRLLVSAVVVLVPSFLVARHDPLALPWFILDVHLIRYQFEFIAGFWFYPGVLKIATIATLVIAARWKVVSTIVTIFFLMNILWALLIHVLFSVYDPNV